jgi:hypothetical protein
MHKKRINFINSPDNVNQLLQIMRKIVLSFVALFCSHCSFSQDNILLKEVQKLSVEKDSLQKVLLRMKTEYAKESEFQLKRARAFEVDLKAKTDELATAQTKNARDGVTFETECSQREQERYKSGKQYVINALIDVYATYSLDELIEKTGPEIIELQSSIVGPSFETTGKKIKQIQKYYGGKKLLEEKYSGEKITSCINQLKSIPESSLTKELIDVLGKYKFYNDELKATLQGIMEIDKKEISFDRVTGDMKNGKIMVIMARYIYNCSNFRKYPYISNVVFSIIQLKTKDPDADISAIYAQL